MSLRSQILRRLSSANAERLHLVAHCVRELQRSYRRPPGPNPTVPVTVFEVREALEELGIQQGDVVHVHSGASLLVTGTQSIKLAGEIVAMLIDLVGPDGTLLMNTDSIKNGWDHAALGAVFDYATSPSRRGLISEVFRRRTDVVRSVHPWYNVTAWGRRAHALVDSHHLSTPYTMDAESPWFKLNAIGGKVLLLGTGYQWNSPIHLVEFMHPVEYPRVVFLDRPVLMRYMTRGRQVAEMPVMLHAPVWKHNAEARFAEHLQAAYGMYRTTTLANGAPLVCYKAQDQYDAVYAEMKRGVTWYDPQFWP